MIRGGGIAYQEGPDNTTSEPQYDCCTFFSRMPTLALCAFCKNSRNGTQQMLQDVNIVNGVDVYDATSAFKACAP